MPAVLLPQTPTPRGRGRPISAAFREGPEQARGQGVQGPPLRSKTGKEAESTERSRVVGAFGMGGVEVSCSSGAIFFFNLWYSPDGCMRFGRKVLLTRDRLMPDGPYRPTCPFPLPHAGFVSTLVFTSTP